MSAKVGFAGLQVRQAAAQALVPRAVFNRPQDALEAALDAGQAVLQLSAAAGRLALMECHLLGEGADELLNQLGCQHPRLKGAEDPLLDALANDGMAVVASAFSAPVGAAVAVLTDDRVAAPAATAGQQPAEQEVAPVGSIEGVALVVFPHLNPRFRLALFDGVPEVLWDDPELRNLDLLPLVARVHPRDAAPGLRVFDVAAAVPGQAADIERVVQQPSASVDLAADRRVNPRAAIRTGDARSVQVAGDRPRRCACRIGFEDAQDDRGFGGDDLAFPGVL